VRRREDQHKAWKPTAWIYGHLPLVIALIVASVGLEQSISAVEHHEIGSAGRWLLVGGVAGVFATLALLQVATEPGEDESGAAVRQKWLIGSRLAGSVLVLATGLTLGASVWALVIAVTVVCALQVAGDVIITDRVGLRTEL
jgi:low temperature requirement protein LtrA